MIVVVGCPGALVRGAATNPMGAATDVARTAARRGAQVQLVGKVGDDDAGDAVLAHLTAAGVGHAALLRDPASATPIHAAPDDDATASPLDEATDAARAADAVSRPQLEPADLDLALRYFTEYRVLVVAEPLAAAVLRVAVDAARYAGATLIVVGDHAAVELPADALVLEAPDHDPDGALATVIGEVAAAIDAGSTPAEAMAAAVASVGATRA